MGSCIQPLGRQVSEETGLLIQAEDGGRVSSTVGNRELQQLGQPGHIISTPNKVSEEVTAVVSFH